MVDGEPGSSLSAAMAAARPGAVITLGAGTYDLTDTLDVGGGVSIRGAGAGRTILDAAGLEVGVRFAVTAPGHAASLDGLAVAGAKTCVEIQQDTLGVRLSHIVVRDCRGEAVYVQAQAEVAIVNATLVANGTAVRAAGRGSITNSIVAQNAVALIREGRGVLTAAYDDLFDNGSDRTSPPRGMGVLSIPVRFADLRSRDLRLLPAQPTTDRGDPADDVGEEPGPNGGRINLGAFGGTADAEASAPVPPRGGGCAGARPLRDPAARWLLASLAFGACFLRRREARSGRRRWPSSRR